MIRFIRKIFWRKTRREPSINERKRQAEYFKNFRPEQLDELFNLYRDYLKHEDGLINYRTTWLVSVQSFLIATFGLSYQKKFEVLAQAIEKCTVTKLEISIYLYDIFLVLLVIVGVYTSYAAIHSVKAALLANEELIRKWEEIIQYYPPRYHLPAISGGGHPEALGKGKKLALNLPLGFLITWLVILLFVLTGICHDLTLLKKTP